MRLGRWLGLVVAALIVTFALVTLVLMQRQLRHIQAARQEPAARRAPAKPWPAAATGVTGPAGASGASGPSGASAPADRRTGRSRPPDLPPGAIW